MPEKLKFYDDSGQGTLRMKCTGQAERLYRDLLNYGIICDRFFEFGGSRNFADRYSMPGSPRPFSSGGSSRKVRALSVGFGSEGSILIEIYLSWPLIRRSQRRIRRDVYSRTCGRVYNSPVACILFSEGIWGAVLSKRYIKIYNRAACFIRAGSG